jgi:hypothetical protein
MTPLAGGAGGATVSCCTGGIGMGGGLTAPPMPPAVAVTGATVEGGKGCRRLVRVSHIVMACGYSQGNGLSRCHRRRSSSLIFFNYADYGSQHVPVGALGGGWAVGWWEGGGAWPIPAVAAFTIPAGGKQVKRRKREYINRETGGWEDGREDGRGVDDTTRSSKEGRYSAGSAETPQIFTDFHQTNTVSYKGWVSYLPWRSWRRRPRWTWQQRHHSSS